LRGITRTPHFRSTCLREVCRGSSDGDFRGPRTLPYAICEGLLPSPNPPWSWSLWGFHMGVRGARVSLMSTSHRPLGGPREHVICEGSRAHPIFAALACVKYVEEARMTIFVAWTPGHASKCYLRGFVTLPESSLELPASPHKVSDAPVSLMSTSQRPLGGPRESREHVICEGSRAHPIFAALACVKCVEEARMTILVGR
jgi:RNase P/RNase MRP subunit POP5